MDISFDAFKEFKQIEEKKEIKCPSCGGSSDNFIIQSSEGVQLCKNCGTHISDVLISEKQEWTNGAENSFERCSTVADKLLSKQSKSTWITGLPSHMIRTHMFHNFYPNKEQGVLNMYHEIDKIGKKCNLNTAIKYEAKVLCKKVNGKIISRGNTRKGIICAAIMQAYKSKTVDYLKIDKMAKICEIDKKYIRKGMDTIAKINFEENKFDKLIPRGIDSYATEYMANLELESDIKDSVISFIEYIEPKVSEINNMPASIAGGCIYSILREKYEEEELAIFRIKMKEKCDLNEITINHCYENIVKVLHNSINNKK